VIVSTCSDNTNFETVISVYKGSSCDALDCLTGATASWCDWLNFIADSSTVGFFGQQNVTYYVRVHGSDQSEGDFELTVEESDKIVDSGINDFCFDSNATFLVAGVMVTGSLNGAQNYYAQSCVQPFSGDVGLWCK
jgi:hypothetical protein